MGVNHLVVHKCLRHLLPLLLFNQEATAWFLYMPEPFESLHVDLTPEGNTSKRVYNNQILQLCKSTWFNHQILSNH